MSSTLSIEENSCFHSLLPKHSRVPEVVGAREEETSERIAASTTVSGLKLPSHNKHCSAHKPDSASSFLTAALKVRP